MNTCGTCGGGGVMGGATPCPTCQNPSAGQSPNAAPSQNYNFDHNASNAPTPDSSGMRSQGGMSDSSNTPASMPGVDGGGAPGGRTGASFAPKMGGDKGGTGGTDQHPEAVNDAAEQRAQKRWAQAQQQLDGGGKGGGSGARPGAGGARGSGGQSPVKLPDRAPRKEGQSKGENAAENAGRVGTQAGIEAAKAHTGTTGKLEKIPGYKKLEKKVVEQGGKKTAKAFKNLKRGGKASLVLAVVAILALFGGGGFVATNAFARNDVLPDHPTEAQCASAQGNEWCEVQWGAQKASSETGGEPVPWSVLAATAHYATDTGRKSPSDSIDRSPTRGGTSAGSNNVPVVALGDSLYDGYKGPLAEHKQQVNLTNTDANVGKTTGWMLDNMWEGRPGKDIDGNPIGVASTFPIQLNVLVFAGTNDEDPVEFGKNVNTFLDRMPGSQVFWPTLYSVGYSSGAGNLDERMNRAKQFNTVLADIAAKRPSLHLVRTGEDVQAHRDWISSDSLHLNTTGWQKGAETIANAISAEGATASAVAGSKRTGSKTTVSSPTTTVSKANTLAYIPSNGPVSGAGAGVAATAAAADRVNPLQDMTVGTPFKQGGSWSCGWHTGIDLPVGTGTPTFAVADGTVGVAGDQGAYGNSVTLDLKTVFVRYAHLSALSVTTGQTVKKGQQIGMTGSTGNSTGPHLHFEVMKQTQGPTQYDCGAFEDPAAWLSGAGTAPNGTPGGAGAVNTAALGSTKPAPISDNPSWTHNVDSLNKPGSSSTCPVPTITPPIEGPNGSSGPYLLNGTESAKMRAAGQDPNNPCQSAMWIIKELRHGQTVKETTGDHSQRTLGPKEYEAFWTDALQRSGLVVNPSADTSECTNFPAKINTAEKITWAIACQTANKKLYTITGYSDGKPLLATDENAGTLLQHEAVRVASIFSKLGKDPCDASAQYAGVFPLTEAQAKAAKLGNHSGFDRCKVDDNIAVAAKLVVDGEAVPVESRPTSAGPYQPMLGGWATMPWAVQNTDALVRTGPVTKQGPDDTIALNKNKKPSASPTTGSSAHVASEPVLGAAVANPVLLNRFTIDNASAAPVPAVDDAIVSPSLPNPMGLRDMAAEVSKYSIGLAGSPVKDEWVMGDCAAPNAVNATNVSVAPSADMEANAATIFKFLKANGATDAGAAGALGNMQAEARLDPTLMEGGGPIIPGVKEGVGLIQWSFGRREALWAAADAKKVKWQDMAFQLGFMMDEIRESYPKTLAVITTATDPVQAAVDFHSDYEGSNDSPEMIANNRGATAKAWFDKLKGTAGPSGSNGKGGAPGGAVGSAVGSAAPVAGTCVNQAAGQGATLGNGKFASPLKTPPPTVRGGKVYAAGAGPHSVGGAGSQDMDPRTWGVADIDAEEGTEVFAYADGVVEFSGPSSSYGPGYVKVVNGESVILYAHQKDFAVQAGQTVKAGQLLSKVGPLGYTHLHFEWKNTPTLIDHGCFGAMPWLPGPPETLPPHCEQ